MTTLVIHPFDPTTAFLGHIYFDKDWTVFNHSTSKKHLKEAIKSHDRIIMLGHGTEYGLIGYGRFVIDSSWVYLLRQKQIVAIWCNADIFVKKYGLKGFYTGMIISEEAEADFYSMHQFTVKQIEDSNKLFAEAMREGINSPEPVKTALSKYESTDANPIVEYNRKNIYSTDEFKILHD